MVQTPPPSISPKQMTILRIATAMAWSDGGLTTEEVNVLLDRLSQLFASSDQQQQLRQELQDYMMQNLPLDELLPKLQTNEEKELVLRLAYEVIRSSSRVPSEDKINQEEASAYQKLVTALNLPPDKVKQIESEIESEDKKDDLIDLLTERLGGFV
ncbi:TerB family tellurite resistance protein [Leptolyngbya ohadii]|uniref:tellurite resistance TerB family protein n=1 Tax=Leptolyngbya ohadii TaxID=1962290 RepID=UPI000B59C456|nr:TerB family tellurite resistance protein [Leptolyngbya ohadii]